MADVPRQSGMPLRRYSIHPLSMPLSLGGRMHVGDFLKAISSHFKITTDDVKGSHQPSSLRFMSRRFGNNNV